MYKAKSIGDFINRVLDPADPLHKIIEVLDIRDDNFQDYYIAHALPPYLSEEKKQAMHAHAIEGLNSQSCIAFRVKLPADESRWPIFYNEFERLSFHPFTSYSNGLSFYVMVPPFSLIQATLNGIFGDDAITLRPIHGLVSQQRFVDMAFQNHHPLALFSPGCMRQLPHGYWTGRIDASMHDVYHAYLISSIPQEHRKLFLMIAEEAAQYRECHPDMDPAWRKVLLNFIWDLYDMEAVDYKKEKWKHGPMDSKSLQTSYQKFISLCFQKIGLDKNQLIPFWVEICDRVAARPDCPKVGFDFFALQ